MAGRLAAPTTIIPPAEIRPTAELCDLPLIRMRDLALLTTDTPSLMRWLAKYWLLSNERRCHCPAAPQMRLQHRQGDRYVDGWAWACKECHGQESIRMGFFFERSHLALNQLVDFVYWWALKTPLKDIMLQCDIQQPHTSVDWANFCRDVCAQVLIDHPMQLGGPNIEVEVDKSKFFHRKYHVGNYREGHWVLGMVERGSNKCMMVVVENRRAETLLPILQQYILPSSRVITDGWQSYNGLAAMGFNHASVNHRLNFVDPQDPTVHTNTIEGSWAHCKAKLHQGHGTSNGLFKLHLQEFLWRRLYPNEHHFGNFLYWVTHYYPL